MNPRRSPRSPDPTRRLPAVRGLAVLVILLSLQATRYADGSIDPRTMPVVGAAYLLGGDFDVPFERALRPRSVD